VPRLHFTSKLDILAGRLGLLKNTLTVVVRGCTSPARLTEYKAPPFIVAHDISRCILPTLAASSRSQYQLPCHVYINVSCLSCPTYCDQGFVLTFLLTVSWPSTLHEVLCKRAVHCEEPQSVCLVRGRLWMFSFLMVGLVVYKACSPRFQVYTKLSIHSYHILNLKCLTTTRC
jgi:hypothetical protein